MDGMMGKLPEVVFMAATNNPEFMDAAALRGGRFGEKIYMGLLKGADLVAFLEKAFAERQKVSFAADLTPQTLAEKFEEVAPADVLSVLRKAVNYTLSHQDIGRPVTMEDVDRAIEKSRL
jgi:transitional endoplasmic reticulum ATPase